MLFSRLIILFLLLLLPGGLSAETLLTGSAEEPVDLEAEQLTFDEQAGRYLARGKVRLRHGDLELLSDELWWNQQSGDIEAAGNVVMEGPGERLSGARAHYNLRDRTGFVEQGQGFLSEHNLRVSGSLIEKRGEADYRVVDGVFTTCDGEVPAWKFSAGELDVTLGGYAEAKHAVFYLKDIPSFYLPYMIYPVTLERQSGFLMPRFGYSDRRGMEYSLAYYQVIGRNQDATLYLDYLTDLGFGKGLEYRYVFGRDNAGEARGYHIDVEDDNNQHALAWEHEGTLPGRVRLSADTMYVSDEGFFEDFGEEAGEYNKDQTVSVLSLTRNWGLFNLVGQLRYIDNLDVDDKTTLQWLPRISFDSVRQRLGNSPVFYRLDSEYTYFWREEGMKSQRLRVRPALMAPFKLWRTIDLVPELGWTERHYWTSGDGPGHVHKGVVDFSTRASSRFYRIYPWSTGSVDRIRHSVEPEIRYLYVPEVSQQGLPEFDSFDRIDEINRIEYGLTQRLTTRSVKTSDFQEYRDLLYLRLSQSYDLLPDGHSLADFSALRSQLTLNPVDYFLLSTDSRYDFDRGRWDEYSGNMRLQDLRGNRMALEYRRRKATAEDEAIDYADLKLETSWLKPVYLGYRNRFDLSGREQLEQVFDIEYRHQCWSFLVTLRERDDDKSIMLTFSLGGIGTVGSIGGNIGGG